MTDSELIDFLDKICIMSGALACAIDSKCDRIDISGLKDLIKLVNPTAEVAEGIRNLDGESLTMALHDLKSLINYIR